jgi:hypothetical protein
MTTRRQRKQRGGEFSWFGFFKSDPQAEIKKLEEKKAKIDESCNKQKSEIDKKIATITASASQPPAGQQPAAGTPAVQPPVAEQPAGQPQAPQNAGGRRRRARKTCRKSHRRGGGSRAKK